MFNHKIYRILNDEITEILRFKGNSALSDFHRDFGCLTIMDVEQRIMRLNHFRASGNEGGCIQFLVHRHAVQAVLGLLRITVNEGQIKGGVACHGSGFFPRFFLRVCFIFLRGFGFIRQQDKQRFQIFPFHGNEDRLCGGGHKALQHFDFYPFRFQDFRFQSAET